MFGDFNYFYVTSSFFVMKDPLEDLLFTIDLQKPIQFGIKHCQTKTSSQLIQLLADYSKMNYRSNS